MKFAIIAAGDGSRLRAEGVEAPKPLVKVGGECLIDRLLRIFLANHATEIVVICNEHMTDVARHLVDIQNEGLAGQPVPLRFVIQSTPSSMHSFHVLSQYLRDEPFVLTTVDTIFDAHEFARYVRTFSSKTAEGADALMGVTDYIDDEKPLYVGVDEQMTVTGYYDTPQPDSRYISAGIYGLTPRTLTVLDACIERGEHRMRNFQRALVAEGLQIEAYPLTHVFDIDHASDIRKAESRCCRCLLIQRAQCFSPHSVDKDFAVLQALSRQLGGAPIVSEEEITAGYQLPASTKTVYSMARSEAALSWLSTLEAAGVTVVNPTAGVRACRRSNINKVMQMHHLPLPPDAGADGYWVKRGDGTAQSKDDVRFCQDEEALAQAKADLRQRGVTDIVVQAHVKGDLVKFYGVEGADFFRCYYPTDDGETKFGDEALNGTAQHYPFSMERLKQDAEHLSRLLHTPVYGGDAIVKSNGTYVIIDFNDWPSFSRCREEMVMCFGEDGIRKRRPKSF